MQDWRFDELTRTLSKATSRRQVLKGLLGGALGATFLSQASSTPVAAASTAPCDRQQCLNTAADMFTNCTSACGSGSRDGGAVAFCKAICWLFYQGEKYSCSHSENGCFGHDACCSGTCIDIYNDDHNCGACGHACSSLETCYGGDCRCVGGTVCSGQCIDTQTDRDNCGACGNACTPCQICQDGQCVDSCGANAACCNNQCVSTQCTAPKIYDPSQCGCVCPFGGDCGDTCCSGSQDCCGGQCYDPCPTGQQRDPATCQCVCASGETCGPFCCDSSKICCPDSLSGMSCRDPNGNCGCNTPCGDTLCCDLYTEVCCRSADYSWHCIAPGGTC